MNTYMYLLNIDIFCYFLGLLILLYMQLVVFQFRCYTMLIFNFLIKLMFAKRISFIVFQLKVLQLLMYFYTYI